MLRWGVTQSLQSDHVTLCFGSAAHKLCDPGGYLTSLCLMTHLYKEVSRAPPLEEFPSQLKVFLGTEGAYMCKLCPAYSWAPIT